VPQGSGVEGAEVFEVFENERYRDQIGWSAKNLELDDPKNFTWAYGESDQFVTPRPPEGYDFLGIWLVSYHVKSCLVMSCCVAAS
jgi:hypothetical protein